MRSPNWIRRTILPGAWTMVLGGIATGCSHDESVNRTIALDRGAPVKIFNGSGRVRIVGWAKDSLRVDGALGHGERFYWLGDARGVKLGVLESVGDRTSQPSTFTVHVPLTSDFAAKTASAEIDVDSASGFAYTVSGGIHVGGAARSMQVESVSGAIEVDCDVPWLRARTASGPIQLRGRIGDVAGASVAGGIVVGTTASSRVTMETMSGSITLPSALAPGASVSADTHDGAIIFQADSSTAARVEMERSVGEMRGRSRSFVVGHPSRDPARVRLTTFSGQIDVCRRRVQDASGGAEAGHIQRCDAPGDRP